MASLLFHIGFLDIRVIDLFDVLIVTFLLYRLYHLLRGGVAINIFIGLLTLYALYWICVKVLHMQLLGTVLGQFISLGFIALIVGAAIISLMMAFTIALAFRGSMLARVHALQRGARANEA